MKDFNFVTSLGQNELSDLVRGATFLASGGGGTYDSAMQLVDHFTKEYYPVAKGADVPAAKVIRVNDIPENDPRCAVVLAYLGTPTQLQNPITPDAAIHSVEAIREELRAAGKELGYIVPIEMGAISTLVSCLVAAMLDLTVIDADGAGRAVPLLQMTTFAINGADVNPCVLTNKEDYKLVYHVTKSREASSSVTIETLARSALLMDEFRQVGGITMWTMDRKCMNKAITIRGSVSKCVFLGKAFREQQYKNADFNKEEIENTLQTIDYIPVLSLKGTIINAENIAEGGFDRGLITIKLEGEDHFAKIIFQNESLIIWDTEKNFPLVTAPDLISYLILPEDPLKRQLLYSNSDIIDLNTLKLRKDLENKDIIVFGLRAPRALSDQANDLIADPVLRSFQEVLERMGYYGQYVPL